MRPHWRRLTARVLRCDSSLPGRSRSSATPRRGRRIGALPLAVVLAPLALSLRPTSPEITIGLISPAHCCQSSPLGTDASCRFSPIQHFPAPPHLSRMNLLRMRGGNEAPAGRSPSPLPPPPSRGPSPAGASRALPPSWPHPSSGQFQCRGSLPHSGLHRDFVNNPLVDNVQDLTEGQPKDQIVFTDILTDSRSESART